MPHSSGGLRRVRPCFFSSPPPTPARAPARTTRSPPTPPTPVAGARRARTTRTTAALAAVVGISTVAAPAETAKHGYIGQLYEVTALQLAATPTTVNETATRQLSAAQLLDDLTTSPSPPRASPGASPSGPLTGINASGLATAGTVYQNTAATAQGIFAGNTGTLGLTVLDTHPRQLRRLRRRRPRRRLAGAILRPEQSERRPAARSRRRRAEQPLRVHRRPRSPPMPLSVFSWRIDRVPGLPARRN